MMGTATYTDDVKLPGMLHAVFVRAGVAHGVITRIDTSEARSAPGVVGAFTGEDLGPARHAGGRAPGRPAPASMDRPVLAYDRVRFLGEPIAVVVAQTRAQAVDAAELVQVDVDPLGVVVDPVAAGEDGAPPAVPRARQQRRVRGAGRRRRARRRRGHRARALRQPARRRGAAGARRGLAAPDVQTGGLTLWIPCQAPHRLRAAIARTLGLEVDAVRVIAPAVGGGFGARIPAYPEHVVAGALARTLDRPVRYVESRWETMVSMQHGRDAGPGRRDRRAGATARSPGSKVRVLANCGAYPHHALPMPVLTGLMSCGVYAIPKVDFAVPLRGDQHHADRCLPRRRPAGGHRAGRARDRHGRRRARARPRRRAPAATSSRPTTSRTARSPAPTTTPASTGARSTACSSWRATSGLCAEQSERRERGDVRQLGVGISSVRRVDRLRRRARHVRGRHRRPGHRAQRHRARTARATSPRGRSSSRARLGVAPEDVTIVQSDTRLVARGLARWARARCRSAAAPSSTPRARCSTRRKKIAAHELEASEDDIEVVPGQGPRRRRLAGHGALLGAARRAGGGPAGGDRAGPRTPRTTSRPRTRRSRSARTSRSSRSTSRPATCELIRHISVDDAGRITNPMLVEGQVHGGIAQGVAQALLEEISYDESGNCLTRLAGELHDAQRGRPAVVSRPCARRRRPIATRSARRASARRARSARRPRCRTRSSTRSRTLGVTHVDMPAHPERVWRAIQAA